MFVNDDISKYEHWQCELSDGGVYCDITTD